MGVGQNSTLFTRTLESISTRATSTASLTFYDTGSTANTNDFELVNVQAISGTFQLIYDGEETAVMQASASAADMQDAIAGISTIGIAPTVTKTFSTGATTAARVPGPHSNAAAAHSNSVTWTIEFSAKSGDAKKLTFKYTDALLTTSAAGTAAAAAASVHDELAADVTVGSTFDVKSSEQFMMYFFDELTAGIPNTNDVDAKMCATWVSANANNLKIVFEYDGEFSTPTDMCVSATSFTTDALLATGLNSLAGVANGLVVVVGQDIRGAATDAAGSDSQPTPSDDSFNKYFPWGLTATGAAHGMITVTLPLGLDGSKFRMHLQTVNGIQLGLASTGKAGQVYVHRARNNNGRTFEVTQAYENKVAGMTHFSKANAATAADGTAAAALDTLGSVMGSLTIGSVTAPTSGFNPGTYYNVKISQDSGTATPKGGGFGIYAKVVVSIGGISHVEVTAGGYAAKASDVYTIKCDTRIHTAFTDCNAGAAGGTRQDVTVKAGTNGAADLQNIALVGLRVGAIGPATATVADLCADGEIQRRFANTATAAATSGMLLSVQLLWRCSKANADGAAAVATDLTDVVVLAPGAPNGAATFSKVTELEHVNKLILKLKAAADTVATFEKADINTFYYQAGFYDTVTPQFNQDSLHASSLDGEDVQESEMMAVMGGSPC